MMQANVGPTRPPCRGVSDRPPTKRIAIIVNSHILVLSLLLLLHHPRFLATIQVVVWDMAILLFKWKKFDNYLELKKSMTFFYRKITMYNTVLRRMCQIGTQAHTVQ
jgi:hypothetical protein